MKLQKKLAQPANQLPELKLVHNKAPQKSPVSCRYCELREEKLWNF